MDNRQMRRAKASAFKKQVKAVVKTGEWGEWEDKSLDFRQKRMANAFAFYANNIYSVQVYNDNGQKVLGIRRHDQSANISWSDKQRIKDELFGKESFFNDNNCSSSFSFYAIIILILTHLPSCRKSN